MRNKEKHNYCKQLLFKGLLSALFLCIALGINAQNITVNGVVHDERGEPLIGVSVMAKGTTTGTITDIDGAYTISAPGNGTLVFSYLGMNTVEETINNRTNIPVTLIEDRKELDELVVIGYGTVKKRDLTGSVSSVKASDVNMTASTSIAHALKGKAAGLSVIQNSAQPGGGLDILVRGAGSVNAGNDPLYIVDGFPIAKLDQPSHSGSNHINLDAGTQSILNFLNPNDIESIEVLKDASATAIYGSRAANGVVLITTKRGTQGKTTVDYSFSYGIQKHSNMFDIYTDLGEWMTERNRSSFDYWMYQNNIEPYGTTTYLEALEAPVNGLHYKTPYTQQEIDNAGPGTNWIDLITQTGKIQQHNISVQGGTEKTKYMVSLNYYDHEGIVKKSGLTRYTAKVNLDQQINKYIKTGVNIIGSRMENDNRALGDGQYEHSGLLRMAVQMGPHIAAINEDGTYPINPLAALQPNPYSLLTIDDKGKTDRLLANANVIVEPLKGLIFKVNFGADIAYQNRSTYTPTTTFHGERANGLATISQNLNEQYMVEGTVNYSKEFNTIHRFNVLGGASYEKFNASGHGLGNTDFLTDGFLWYNMGAGVGVKSVSSHGSENKMKSFFTRVNYVLMDRYLLTATFRADGASVFARNHKWGYFPSVAAGWNIAEESFMEEIRETLSMLKLRASYGQTGNADIGDNAFAAYGAWNAWNNQDKSPVTGVFLDRLENPDLKWETTTEFNVGLDIAFFDGKISAAFEYYDRIISDLLNYKALNSYHDISQVVANIGKTQSRGFEATINTKNFTRRNFTWATDFTFSTYSDRWLERTDDWKPSVYENEKDPIRPIYSRLSDRILQIGDQVPAAQPLMLPGEIIIKDVDGYLRDEYGDPEVDDNGRFIRTSAPDGIIDDADMRLLGTRDPGYIMGLSNRFTFGTKYGNIDFSFDFNGLFDRVMMDPTHMALGASADAIGQNGYNGLRVPKRWTPNYASTTQPSSFYYGKADYGYGDWFYQKAWFIRLQSITLGYTLPKIPALNKVFSNLRVYFDVNNVFVITPYTGLDPETDVYTAAYPNARTFSFGLDVKF